MASTSTIETKYNNTYDGAEFIILVNDSPLNLTNAALRMMVRIAPETPVLAEFNLGSGLTIVDAANGKFRFDAQVITIPPGSYKYDILITLPNGVQKTYPAGNFIVRSVVTYG